MMLTRESLYLAVATKIVEVEIINDFTCALKDDADTQIQHWLGILQNHNTLPNRVQHFVKHLAFRGNFVDTRNLRQINLRNPRPKRSSIGH